MAHRRKVGDVYAVTLPDGRYAFGRLMEDTGMQFFDHTSPRQDADISKLEIKFTVNVYNSEFKSPSLVFIKNVPFANEDDAWPPKTYMHDPIYKKYSIYYKGEFTPSTKEECNGLEPMAVWGLDHIIDQITGKRDWFAIMKDAEKQY
jgi:hypothetical protein